MSNQLSSPEHAARAAPCSAGFQHRASLHLDEITTEGSNALLVVVAPVLTVHASRLLVLRKGKETQADQDFGCINCSKNSGRVKSALSRTCTALEYENAL